MEWSAFFGVVSFAHVVGLVSIASYMFIMEDTTDTTVGWLIYLFIIATLSGALTAGLA
jgi:hypothetical protein